MAASSDFVPFATGIGANVASQADYVAAATTGTGYTPGVASSELCNKSWRQATFQAAVLASLVANVLNINVADNGNLTAAVNNLLSALNAIIAQALAALPPIGANTSLTFTPSAGTVNFAMTAGFIGTPLVFLNGAFLTAGVDYNISGNILALTIATNAGDRLTINLLLPA